MGFVVLSVSRCLRGPSCCCWSSFPAVLGATPWALGLSWGEGSVGAWPRAPSQCAGTIVLTLRHMAPSETAKRNLAADAVKAESWQQTARPAKCLLLRHQEVSVSLSGLVLCTWGTEQSWIARPGVVLGSPPQAGPCLGSRQLFLLLLASQVHDLHCSLVVPPFDSTVLWAGAGHVFRWMGCVGSLQH